MIRSARPRLHDIDENIAIALDLIRGRTLKHLAGDHAFRYALQYAILIIAEAVHHLPAELKATEPTIPWPNIKSIGDRLRHEYHRVDPDIIWDVATVHLIPLQSAIKRMLTDMDA